jgi:hypothetical protein
LSRREDQVSILVARSMARAHYVATMEYRFAVLAQARYACAAGGLVKAIPDGWNGLYALPHGTPVFLVSGWEQRDDAAEIRERLASGQLIQAALH